MSNGQMQITREPKLVVTCDCCGSDQFVPIYYIHRQIMIQPLCIDCKHAFVEEEGDLCPACETKRKISRRECPPTGQSRLEGVD